MEVIIAAVITATGGLLAVGLQKLRRENTQQHAEGRALIKDLHADVKDVKSDVRDVKADVRDLRGRVSDLEDGSTLR